MKDEASAALERLKEIASRRDDGVAMCLWSEEARAILDHIAALEARAEKAEAALGRLRPHWAKGYTDDSVAAQVQTAALSQVWEALGVNNQTDAMQKLAALEARAEAAESKVAAAEERGLVFNMLPDGRLDFCAIREGSRLWDSRVRAEAAEAREAELRAAAERLNAELDAFWNEPAEIKYPEGRMNVVYEQLITDAQMACRQALAAAPAPESRERKLDKRRLDGLRELCGHVEDGSETSVRISQDDATRAWIIRAGKRWWHGKSLRAALDAALGDARHD